MWYTISSMAFFVFIIFRAVTIIAVQCILSHLHRMYKLTLWLHLTAVISADCH